MAIVWGAIAPHPPLVVPEIGGQEIDKVSDTRDSLQELARSLKDQAADVIVITTPHGPVFKDAVALSVLPSAQGDFAAFGVPEASFDLQLDQNLTSAIMSAAHDRGLTTVGLDAKLAARYRVDQKLDHGVLVPWYYFAQAGLQLPLVWVGMSMLPPQKLYAFGQAVQDAAAATGRRVAFLASADLSHSLIPGAPAGFHPDGARFDKLLVDLIGKGDLQAVLDIDRSLADNAKECGWRSIMMLLGAVDGQKVAPKVLSYEGPFGVGYLVADLAVAAEGHAGSELGVDNSVSCSGSATKESPHVRLARASLEHYVRTGHELAVPKELPAELLEPAGAFVTLERQGQLRGCIGTTEPTKDTLAAEIISNAVSAGTRDPRFWPVTEEELVDMAYSVDVLGMAQKVDKPGQLDPKRYGIIVSGGRGQRGLLLPDLEGVDSVEEQIRIAKQKAGLRADQEIVIERFEVRRYR